MANLTGKVFGKEEVLVEELWFYDLQVLYLGPIIFGFIVKVIVINLYHQ